jgi:replicative DNA helicase
MTSDMPNVPECERGLLSCILLDGAAGLAKALDGKIVDGCFHDENCLKVWKGLVWLAGNNLPIETAVLVEELKKKKRMEKLGMKALLEITSVVPTTAQFSYFIEQVREAYVRRSLIENAEEAIAKAKDGTGTVEEYVQKAFDILSLRHATEKAKTLTEATDASIEHAKRIMAGLETEDDKGLAWPWGDWNTRFGAARGGEMIILAARPGMGKSSAARQCALKWQETGEILFFSREMPIDQLPCLFAQQISGASWKAFRRGGLPMDMQNAFMRALEDVRGMKRLHIFDRDRTLAQITARVRAFAQRKPVKAVIIDYLQRYDPQQEKGETRDTALGRMSMAFKDMAIDLNVPALVLAQVGRGMEREKRQPVLSDLRESGNLEQDADRVVFLWAPEERPDGGRQDPFDGSINDLYVEAIQAKGRGEGQDRAGMTFRKPTTTFFGRAI